MLSPVDSSEDRRFVFKDGTILVVERDEWTGVDQDLVSINPQTGQWEKVLKEDVAATVEYESYWVEQGFLPDLRLGGGIVQKSEVINGEERQFLAWRLGFTEIYVDI